MAGKDITRIQLLKTVSWRLLSSLLGFSVLYLTTDNFYVSGGFTMVELLVKPVLYFIHEKTWEGAEKRAMKKTL